MSELYDQAETEGHQEASAPAALNAMNVAFTPRVGELWELLYADVFHDDAAGPAGAWRFTDGVTMVQFGNAAALAVATRVSLYTAEFPPKLYLDHRCTLDYDVAAGATNGSILTMSIIGRKLSGVL